MAQYILGMMYMRGKGVPQDYAEGIKFYRLAAEQGNDAAQLSLGACYLSGMGIPQDHIQAHMWLNLAAVGGNQDAIKLRKEAEQRMTRQQVSEAQRLSREWVLDSLHLTAPVLAGHSLGGHELTAVASAHPNRISGLVYMDSTADPTFD